MSRSGVALLEWALVIFVPLLALAHFIESCTPQPAPTPAQPAVDSGETCEAACARRSAAGCLDVTPELCVETCRRVRDAGLYAPERCRR